jgi:hypothetical protein
MNMLAAEQLVLPIRIATVVVPVALYFLVIGLLNSRKHPQLLPARQDLALLVAALSPLLLSPIADAFGHAVAAGLVVAGLLAAAAALMRPASSWVIYNVSRAEASEALERALCGMNAKFETVLSAWHVDGGKAVVELTEFPLLRNITVRVRSGERHFAAAFGAELSRALVRVEAQTSPMAAGLLLVATGMLIAPLALVMHRAPELVRVLTDLLH